MIRLEQVTKTYKRSTRPALDAISVEMDRGEFVFLIGPSGEGYFDLFLYSVNGDGQPTTQLMGDAAAPEGHLVRRTAVPGRSQRRQREITRDVISELLGGFSPRPREWRLS